LAQRDATSVDVEPGSKPGFDAKVEPKDEPKLQDENRPDSKPPDEPPRPGHKGEVQQAEPPDTGEAAQPRVEQDLSDRIRERAYEMWIASGYRDGEAEQHWLAAEHQILSSLRSADVAKVPAKWTTGRTTVKRPKGD
jgi:hypothetical protein